MQIYMFRCALFPTSNSILGQQFSQELIYGAKNSVRIGMFKLLQFLNKKATSYALFFYKAKESIILRQKVPHMSPSHKFFMIRISCFLERYCTMCEDTSKTLMIAFDQEFSKSQIFKLKIFILNLQVSFILHESIKNNNHA